MHQSSTLPRPEEKAIPATIKDYLAIARPDHWFKNIFMFPGMVFAFRSYQTPMDSVLLGKIFLGLFCTCLIASANYVINEYLDAEFDKFHPEKKNRTAVNRVLNPWIVYSQYAGLAITGLSLSYLINFQFFYVELFLLLMGLLYNVRPFRTKERVYIDVLSESINNPIRFVLGWLIFIPATMLPEDLANPSWILKPPSSIIIAYWMGGAFLMATKRFAEYRFINNPEIAGLYRKSFKDYTEDKLLVSMFFYAIITAFFLGIFLIKNRIELLISFPFFALLFAWYFQIGLSRDSVVQGPENLHKERTFMVYVIAFSLLLLALLFIDIPELNWFLEKSF